MAPMAPKVPVVTVAPEASAERVETAARPPEPGPLPRREVAGLVVRAVVGPRPAARPVRPEQLAPTASRAK